MFLKAASGNGHKSVAVQYDKEVNKVWLLA
jgi:hypothetical protein